MRIADLDGLLNKTPVCFRGNPLFLLGLEALHAVNDSKSFLKTLDSPTAVPDGRYIILKSDGESIRRFPGAHMKGPLPIDLNESFVRKYDSVRQLIPEQSHFSDILFRGHRKDVILAVLVDGLSFWDLQGMLDVAPCLVTGPTITSVGLRNLVGYKGGLARRAYELGYRRREGYAYWTREDNQLTDELFFGFAPGQHVQVEAEEEILLDLSESVKSSSFVQIVIEGCDQFCHGHRGKPPVDTVIQRIIGFVKDICESMKERSLSYRLGMTADHGILWKWDVNEEAIIPDSRTTHMRYYTGRIITQGGLQVSAYGKGYTLLPYPVTTRPFRKNEWGCHGGVSLQESIVPLIIKEG